MLFHKSGVILLEIDCEVLDNCNVHFQKVAYIFKEEVRMKKVGKTLNLLLVLVLVLSLVGCGSTKTGNNQQSASSAGSITKEADLVVVGGGGAGLSAAIEAASQGKKVIMLEKQSILGGNTNFAEGIFAVDSPIQKQMGITTDKMHILREELEFGNYHQDALLWNQVINDSAANIQWLLDMGMKFHTVASLGAGEKTWHLYEGMGKALVKDVLAPKAEKLGVDIMLNTPGKEIIMDNEVVSGVKASNKEGKDVIIKAKAVILATGGFADDKEMVKTLAKVDPSRIVFRGAPGHDGDGIKMAQKVGATSNGWGMLAMLAPTLQGTSITSHMGAAATIEPNNLWVNNDGLRFVNEDVIFEMTRASNAFLTQSKTFSVMDSSMMNKRIADGCVLGVGAYVPPGTKLVKLNEEIQKALDAKDPNVFKADTLDELATKMGVNKENFLATVNKYNGYAASGADTEFGKNPMFITPIKTGPFYAFNLKLNGLNTMGGIKVNTKSEVLNAKQEPIKGLYAAGMDCDGYTGDTYGLVIPGSDQGIAVFTGRDSAINAVKYISTLN